MGEFPGSLDYFVNENRVFIDALVPKSSRYAIVLHKTACGSVCTAEEQGVFFQTNPEEKSVHYVVGKDGHVVQCVREKDGAGGNCCLENGYDTFWDKAPTKANLNLCTFSIEHCDYSVDNSEELTDEQKTASFKLVAYLAHKYSIGIDHIKGHNTLDPISRHNCPGNYPWAELFNYLKGEGETVGVPTGWNDDPKTGTLTAPNKVTVIKGFRDWILANKWEPWNIPLEEEHIEQSVLESDISLGPGTRQAFASALLVWTEHAGVFNAKCGSELLYVKKDRDNCRVIISELQNQIGVLKQGLPSVDMNAVLASVDKLAMDIRSLMN